MSVFIIRIDERGRIVLPVNVRESMELKLGDFVFIEHSNDEIKITNKRRKNLRNTAQTVQVSRNCFERI